MVFWILQLIKRKQKLNFEIAHGNLPVQSQCLTKNVPKNTTLKSEYWNLTKVFNRFQMKVISKIQLELWKTWQQLKFKATWHIKIQVFKLKCQRFEWTWNFISIECKEETTFEILKKTWYVKAETVEKWILQIISGISNPTNGDGKISEYFEF